MSGDRKKSSKEFIAILINTFDSNKYKNSFMVQTFLDIFLKLKSVFIIQIISYYKFLLMHLKVCYVAQSNDEYLQVSQA